MIDTLRISMPKRPAVFLPKVEKYITFKNRENDFEKVIINQLDSGNPNYRAFWSAAGGYSIEFNLGKVLYLNNYTNYAPDPSFIAGLVAASVAHFCGKNDAFISRIDLGYCVDYGSYDEAKRHLDMYKNARPKGFSANRYNPKQYKHSIFYNTKNWSVKIYNKGIEQKIDSLDDTEGLHGVLRFEKTFRSNELLRLGMPRVPYFGVPADQFDAGLVVDNLFQVFQGWDLQALPFQKQPNFRAGMAAIKIVDDLGLLHQLEQAGSVSRSTMHRYRKKKENVTGKFSAEIKPATFVPSPGWERPVYDYMRSPVSFFNK